MKKEEKENIKVYIRTENRIYAFVEDEIILYEDEELSEVLENLKTDYFWGENEVEAIVILHFSYFIFNENEKNIKNNNINFLKNLLSYRKEKFYMNFTENLFMDIFLEKREIKRIKDTFRKYGWKLCKIKTDFDCLYNYFKDRNMEILQLGEKESIRFVIEDRKISEIEKLELKIEDLGNVDEFDFGDMKVIEVEEENIKSIFMGEELFESPNFIGKSQINLNMNKITVKDIFLIIVVLSGIMFSGYLIPLKKEKKKNEEIRKEIKIKENNYLRTKSEKIPDYSEELEILGEINDSMKRKEYYSLIKFLIDNSIYGIDYTKIEYENRKWTVQGEISNFDFFQKFEKNIEKKYKDIELGYIKDEDTVTLFEYSIIEK